MPRADKTKQEVTSAKGTLRPMEGKEERFAGGGSPSEVQEEQRAEIQSPTRQGSKEKRAIEEGGGGGKMTSVFNLLGFKVLKLWASPVLTDDIAASIWF